MKIRMAFDGIEIEVDGGDMSQPGNLTQAGIWVNIEKALNAIEESRRRADDQKQAREAVLPEPPKLSSLP